MRHKVLWAILFALLLVALAVGLYFIPVGTSQLSQQATDVYWQHLPTAQARDRFLTEVAR
jgi:hypothetical protein